MKTILKIINVIVVFVLVTLLITLWVYAIGNHLRWLFYVSTLPILLYFIVNITRVYLKYYLRSIFSDIILFFTINILVTLSVLGTLNIQQNHSLFYVYSLLLGIPFNQTIYFLNKSIKE